MTDVAGRLRAVLLATAPARGAKTGRDVTFAAIGGTAFQLDLHLPETGTSAGLK